MENLNNFENIQIIVSIIQLVIVLILYPIIKFAFTLYTKVQVMQTEIEHLKNMFDSCMKK